MGACAGPEDMNTAGMFSMEPRDGEGGASPFVGVIAVDGVDLPTVCIRLCTCCADL